MKSRKAAWCAGVLMLIACIASAEAAGPLTHVTSLPLGSTAHDLVLDGNLAYVATDSGLKIVDITDSTAPFLRGSVTVGGRSLGIALKTSGALSHVFLASQAADLKVVDVSNPDVPVVVASKIVAGNAWDVAVKDNVAYVGTLSGQMYLFDITNPTAPVQIKIIGLPAWKSPGSDATNLAKLRAGVTTGSAKVTGISIEGNRLVALDWGYGRLYYYDVANAVNPVFSGTHWAPYLFRAETDPSGTFAYALGAYSSLSGIYSIDLDALGPSFSTMHTTCGTGDDPFCDYFQTASTDYGGLAVSPNGKYVVFIAGKNGFVQVLDVTDPTNMTDAGKVMIGYHQTRTAESMGVQISGNHIFTAAGIFGLKIFTYPGLSD